MPERTTTARAYLFRILLSSVAFGILVLLFYRLGPDQILSLLHQFGWRFLGVVLIFGVQEIVRAIALVQCLPEESRPSFRNLVYIRFIGEAVRAVTLTGPFLSEPTRAWLIRKHGVASSRAVAAAVAEYGANSLISALLTVAGMVYTLKYVQPEKQLRVAALILLWGAVGYLLLIGVVLYRRAYAAGAIAARITSLAGIRSRIESKLAGLRRTEDALLGILRDRPQTVAKLIGLELLAQFLLLAETYWALLSMGLIVSFVTASLAEVFTKLANVAFAGVAEGAYAFLFHALALPAAAGFTLSLIKRLRSLAVALIGVATLALMRDGAGNVGKHELNAQ
jgi:hypothetical protein